ncbi:beta-ketoacyl synthase chain length factor [Povalibacter sp.]|uniref:beta-ketoacyl synthase chain length factor n=1 Tax=Povalibacter sp. TaxID=1962978 RepID=UPI002F41DC6E
MALPAVVIEGVAFWSSRLPGWDVARAVIRGEAAAPDAAAPRPAPTLLAPTERRRAPDTVAIALEVAARACNAAQRSPAELASVFASTHGDLAISDYMCATLVDTPTLISPVKFHNSVHNAAAGYWSIGTGSFATYTALSAFRHTFAAGLLEAVTQVACDGRPVLYVAFDIEAKGPLATIAPSKGLLGAALVLAPCGAATATRMRLRIDEQPGATPANSPAAALIAQNALAPCLPFFEALALQRPGLRLQLGERAGLDVTFD